MVLMTLTDSRSTRRVKPRPHRFENKSDPRLQSVDKSASIFTLILGFGQLQTTAPQRRQSIRDVEEETSSKAGAGFPSSPKEVIDHLI